MKIRIWLVTRDRETWITAAEIIALALVLLAIPSSLVRLVGFLVLAHLGYQALTSLPLGMIPGRPEGTSQHRRNQDLRSRIVGFLNTVRTVEEYAQRVRLAAGPDAEMDRSLRAAHMRVMNAAADVVKAMGKGPADTPDGGTKESRPRTSPRPERLLTQPSLGTDDFLP
ncbi:MAG: hypothetical protein WEB90_06605 [Gemmatimonadota bacterium]